MGCFLNGCCYGATCHLPWGIRWPAGSIPWFDYANQYLESQGGIPGGPGVLRGAVVGALAATWQPPVIHPAQIYALVNALLLFAVLHYMFWHKRRHGQIILAFFLLYGIGRFLEEALRADEAAAYLLGVPTLLRALGHEAAAAHLRGLTISQNVAIVMVLAASIGLAYLFRSRRPEWRGDYVPPAPVLSGAQDSANSHRKKHPRHRKGAHG
jgi:phosphatidylglycerol:prolipoprotein diacylglycerol transferase